jgi:two-component system response regulator PilR (NtrC family)
MPKRAGGAGRILIVEDEASMREVLAILLEEEGYGVVTARDGDEGLALLDSDIFDLVVTDIKMPGAGGFEILGKVREVSPETPVIMITAFGSVESAIEAMKFGAYDYIGKPFKIDEIRVIIRNAIEKRRLTTEVSILKEKVKETYEVGNIIGRSPQMQELLRLVHKVAGISSNVLIRGESGTGKELIANAIHYLSARNAKNLVAINCAAFPEGLLESELFGYMRGAFTGASQNKQGLFETADGGTLFLDEIGEMPPALQAKLLRAIENGTFRRLGGTSDIKVDIRIISATNRDLEREIEQGGFREDLFFRLNAIPLTVPPLRERTEDIPPLVEHFLKKYSGGKRRQFSGAALAVLMAQPWKGNVRELENAIERILLFTDTEIIADEDLPVELREFVRKAPDATAAIDSGGFELESYLAEIEKSCIAEALRRTGGNKTEAARLLGLSFRSLRHKLAKYGIK